MSKGEKKRNDNKSTQKGQPDKVSATGPAREKNPATPEGGREGSTT